MRGRVAAGLVLSFASLPAQGYISTTTRYDGTVNVGGTIVDVYSVSQDAAPGRMIGAVRIGFGNDGDPNAKLATDPGMLWLVPLGALAVLPRRRSHAG